MELYERYNNANKEILSLFEIGEDKIPYFSWIEHCKYEWFIFDGEIYFYDSKNEISQMDCAENYISKNGEHHLIYGRNSYGYHQSLLVHSNKKITDFNKINNLLDI